MRDKERQFTNISQYQDKFIKLEQLLLEQNTKIEILEDKLAVQTHIFHIGDNVKYNTDIVSITDIEPQQTNLQKLVFITFVFITKNDLKTAVNLWCNDNKLAIEKYGDISLWDTSNIIDMGGLFQSNTTFNSDISKWDVSNVTDMSYMFDDATSFNQPLDNWDVSRVTDMIYMFSGATSFNQPLNNWEISNVTDMSEMFVFATSFNQPLDNWDTSNVTGMRDMFLGAISFNQPLDNLIVSNVTDMHFMFEGAINFNQPI